MNRYGARRQVNLGSLARQIIGSPAIHLDRRIGAGHLGNLSSKRRDSAIEGRFTAGTKVACRVIDTLTLGIVGRGRVPQAHCRQIRLVQADHVGQQARAWPHPEHQQSRRSRVQGSRVAYFLCSESFPCHGNHPMGAHSQGFIDEQQARDHLSPGLCVRGALRLRGERGHLASLG